MFKFVFGSLLAVTLAASSALIGQGVPAPLRIRLQPFLSGALIQGPVFITNAGDGTNRMFIVRQSGRIMVLQPGATAPTEFLNIATSVVSGGERGLLGLAFHPQYSTNRRFFVYYTRQPDAAIQIGEYQASAADPNVADTKEKTIITIPHPISNHNGGSVAFGPDGYLYAGPGDGGGANDPNNNSQNIEVLLGKILRIDINNQPPLPAPQYSIPPDNPYAGATPGADEIYALGMRNPYRFSFDRGGARQLWVADVGQGSLEEVNIVTNGGNFGWRTYEGTTCTGLNPEGCAGGSNPINHAVPLFQYDHSGGRCSITGGFVYRGIRGTLPFGSYIHADYCSGEIFLWDGSQQTVIDNTSSSNIVGFGEDESGELYMVREGGPIFKIVRVKSSADLDGDLKSDVAVYRPSEGFYWYILNSSNNSFRLQQFGGGGDQPVPEDYDGDNTVDLAVFRPSNGGWYYLRASDNTVVINYWGADGDTPAPGDYDGDAKADLAVFRPSTGTWYVSPSTGANPSVVSFGLSGDRPVAGDYDGDGKYDIALWRSTDGIWYRINSSSGAFHAFNWGLAGDIPAPGDFDGDGKIDHTVFRPSDGNWYRFQSSNAAVNVRQWGVQDDVPVTGDYDGDSREDIAVFRPSTGIWWILQSSNGTGFGVNWGQAGDIPVPSVDNP